MTTIAWRMWHIGSGCMASYLALALHALDEATHHGGEIGLMRDEYLRQGGA